MPVRPVDRLAGTSGSPGPESVYVVCAKDRTRDELHAIVREAIATADPVHTSGSRRLRADVRVWQAKGQRRTLAQPTFPGPGDEA